MTRTSAIFGVVSVLTAAIVGGVFIRKKIIDDALYWRAWVEAETRWKREIRELESEIGELKLNVKINNKNIEDTSKKIERYKRNIEGSIKDIKELEEKMSSSEHYSITKEVAEIVNKNFNKQENLQDRIKRFALEISTFDESILENKENDSKNKINELKQKIEEFSEILESQKERLKTYADRRIELFKKFKRYKTQKEEKIELKNQFEKSLQDSQSSISLWKSLIEKLMKTLDEKTLQLSNLKKQGPAVII